MDYVKLGRTGLDISPVALGGMTFGDPQRGHPAWSIPEDPSRELIMRSLEAGINFFDTANMYSLGHSEEILGRALKDYASRDDLVIATKVRVPMRERPNGGGLSRKAIMTEIDDSLRRLGIDYIDLYQVHRMDPQTPLEETLETLHDVVKAGKARYLGASSMHAWQFAKALSVQKLNGWTPFVSMQHHYNLLAREEEREMIPLCVDAGVGTIIWSPLARGRLARSWDETASTTRSRSDHLADNLYTSATADSDRAIVEAVGMVARNRGVTRAEVALAWFRSQPAVSAVLVGASRPEQMQSAVAAASLTLSVEEIQALEAPYSPRLNNQGIDDQMPEATKVRSLVRDAE